MWAALGVLENSPGPVSDDMLEVGNLASRIGKSQLKHNTVRGFCPAARS